jgi:hypothetical protein
MAYIPNIEQVGQKVQVGRKATVGPDGRIQMVPIWAYEYEGRRYNPQGYSIKGTAEDFATREAQQKAAQPRHTVGNFPGLRSAPTSWYQDLLSLAQGYGGDNPRGPVVQSGGVSFSRPELEQIVASRTNPAPSGAVAPLANAASRMGPAAPVAGRINAPARPAPIGAGAQYNPADYARFLPRRTMGSSALLGWRGR